MIALILFWILFAALVGALARGYRRSVAGWFLLAMIVSPIIAAIILLLVGPAQPRATRSEPAPDRPPLKGAALVAFCLLIGAVAYIATLADPPRREVRRPVAPLAQISADPPPRRDGETAAAWLERLSPSERPVVAALALELEYRRACTDGWMRPIRVMGDSMFWRLDCAQGRSVVAASLTSPEMQAVPCDRVTTERALKICAR